MSPSISFALLDGFGLLVYNFYHPLSCKREDLLSNQKIKVLTIGKGAVASKPRDIQFGRPYERVGVWWRHCGDLMRTYLIDVGYVFLNSSSGANIE